MKFILAEKREMTQKYAPDGSVIPVTKLSVAPCVITQIKTEAKDGYVALQIGCGFKKNLSKSIKGHLKNLGSFRYLKEFIIEPSLASDLKTGDVIDIDTFTPGDNVQVTGVSKGRGFQGVVRRYHFHGHPASHGHKDQLRHSGAIGAGGVQNVSKGKRMSGRMGTDQVTVKNLKIIEVDAQNQELFVKGAVPGAKGGLTVVVSLAGQIKLKKPTAAEEKKLSVAPEAVKPVDRVASSQPETQPAAAEGSQKSITEAEKQ